jgi:hypothetical protein
VSLDIVRADAADRLPDMCLIYGVTEESGLQGTIRTYTQRGVAEPCRLASLAGREIERAQQLSAEADVVLTFEALTDVRGSDRVVVTNGETGAISDVEVGHVVVRSREITRRVYGKDITP